jgi:hypothetical protein
MNQIDCMNRGRAPGATIDAMVYGSVALQDHTRRSDLDMLAVVPDATEAKDGPALARAIVRLQATGHVAIEPVILSNSAVKAGSHPAITDLLFTEHLRAMEQDNPYVIGHPTIHMRSLEHCSSDVAGQLKAARAMTARYVEHKKHTSITAQSDGDVPVTKALQRSLELPSSLARKMVRVAQLEQLRRGGGWDLDELPLTNTASRYNLEEMVYAVAPADSHWGEHAGRLIEQNRGYTDLLESTITGQTSVDAYDAWLQQTTPDALQHSYQLAIAAGDILLNQQLARTY